MLNATDYADLLSGLKVAPAEVAPRGLGRDKSQVEPWIAHRFLATAAKLGHLDFPLKVVAADRPDLRISCPAGATGVELTEVVPPAYAQAMAIRNQSYPGVDVDRSLFRWGTTFSAQEIHHHLSSTKRPIPRGWAGDEVEQELAAAVEQAIATKTAKLNHPEFTVLQRNWLAIYTSSQGPALDSFSFCSRLPTTLKGDKPLSFDAAFVITNKAMFVISSGSARAHELVEL